MKTRLMNSGRTLVSMMERLVLMEDIASENVSLAPFIEMDMSKIGHASIQVSVGERSWPPAAGYSCLLVSVSKILEITCWVLQKAEAH